MNFKRARAAWLSLPWALAIAATAGAGEPAPSRILDAFDDVRAWRSSGSDGVVASVQEDAGKEGKALRLDFDFRGVAGYAIAARDLPIEFPGNFEISFYVRGSAPANNFEFKLLDETGDNVWWVNRRDFRFPEEWQRVRIKRRHVEFAWGPAADRTLRRAAGIQFVVSAGQGGGSGTVWIDDLRFRELPPEDAPWPAPGVSASSSAPGSGASLAHDGNPATAWRSSSRRSAQVFTLDFRRVRELGGLVLHWQEGAHASRYDVEFSDGGRSWQRVRSVEDGNGGTDFLWLPEADTRYARVVMQAGPAEDFGLAEIEVKDAAFGASPNAFISAIASAAPRGHYPRAFLGEQNYWTVVGMDGGASEGLLSEDGALEAARGSFSIEPFLTTPAGLLTWSDVSISQSLLDGYLPMPTVRWDHAAVALDISVFAEGSTEHSRLVARYEVRNKLDVRQAVGLVLALRPFQVNPPSQWLNTPGGVSPVHEVAWDGRAVSVDGRRRVYPLRAPDAFFGGTPDSGDVPEILTAGRPEPRASIRDEAGLASGALVYRLDLPPGAVGTIDVVLPLDGPDETPVASAADAAGWYGQARAATAESWRAKLNRVAIGLPPVGQELVDTLRTALAHVLINRDGPAIQPGSRSYERSWIRDGAMTSEALLRLGHEDDVRDFLRWYAPHQFPDGKVPCCVDRRGADPVPEHDSHGELIFAIAEHFRYTRDRASLAALWPHVERAIRYMDSLRAAERRVAAADPGQRAFQGLLPASISHEGYSAKPMHSYWDDFWGLKGYEDATEMAAVLGLEAESGALARSVAAFRADLYASLAITIARHGIEYLPGSAELGDFDATSTTIALDPASEQDRLPQAQLVATFERYWQDVGARRDRTSAWDAYTPYEWRSVGSFVRLGWRERAHALIDFHMGMRRPPAWNQWAEVVGRDTRQARFIGDMPHGWVASDFIRSALDLFAYTRPRDSALVLAAGVRPEWLEGAGVSVQRLRTRYGELSYNLVHREGACILKVATLADMPPGGIVIPKSSCRSPGQSALIARDRPQSGDELRLRRVPATLVIRP